MADKKKLFPSLKTLTVSAIAGSAIALSPVVAMAGEHEGDHSCSGKKTECTCQGQKLEDCKKGEHSCKGEKSCSGEKACSGEKGCAGDKE